MQSITTYKNKEADMATGHALVDAISEIAFEGHVIPWSWFQVLRFDNGKPDLSAIMILADIVFWYRPSPILCEETGKLLGHKKRFKADLLQRSYQSWADQFGLTKRQATEAIIRLEKTYKVIRRHFRTIDTTNGRAANVLFIEPCPEHIRAITHQRETCPVRMGHLPRLNGTPPTSQRETNTETTTEITQRKNTPPVSPHGETPPWGEPTSRPRTKASKTPVTHYTDGYGHFWAAYPRKEGKVEAFTIWQARTLEPRAGEIAAKVERLTLTLWAGRERDKIPLPTTYLNQARYEDDLVPLEVVQEQQAKERMSEREYRNMKAAQRFLEDSHAGTGQSTIFDRNATALDGIQYRIE